MDFFVHIASAAAESAAHAEGEASPIAIFGLDWKLLLAQLVNFGIVFLVLWKWVFGPVSKVLESRAKRVEGSIKEAESIVRQKSEFEEWKKGETSKVYEEAKGILAAARAQGEELRVLAKKDLDIQREQILTEARQEIETERRKMLNEAKGELAGLVRQAIEKVLKGHMSKEQEQELLDSAISKLKEEGRDNAKN